MQYYYGDYRYYKRFRWQSRSISTSLDDMKSVDDEDRISVRQKKASETGFTGVSVVHRLYHLYQFDILHDFVYDVMHTVLLRVVKRHLEYFLENGLIDHDVEKRLQQMPWTIGYFLLFIVNLLSP